MDQSLKRILIFSLQGRRYGIDLAVVAEVIDPPSLYPIPKAPPCFLGIMQVHGSLIPVLDLAAYLALGKTAAGELLVLTPGIAHLALRVAAVERIEVAGAIVTGPEATGLFPQKVQLEQGEVPLLDARLLVEQVAALLAGC